MKYQITIKKTEKNENYAVQFAEYKEKNRYHNSNDNFPQEYTVTDALIVELTEDQFKKVKAEVLKAFE